MTVSTKPAKLDSVCESAVDEAREALLEMTDAEHLGAHLGVRVEGERLVTHIFECLLRGYAGWTWTSTVTRLPRTKKVTVCETALLPTDASILAPEWVPFTERLLPGDLGRDDTLPYVADDIRLENGFELVDDQDSDAVQLFELGLGRSRVMSHVGRTDATMRWDEGEFGPMGVDVKSKCGSCGFMLLMAGSLRNAFGVCGNEWSPADGRVVSLEFACGAHSETELATSTQPSRALPVDDMSLDVAIDVTEDAESVDAETEPEPEPAAASDGDTEPESVPISNDPATQAGDSVVEISAPAIIAPAADEPGTSEPGTSEPDRADEVKTP